MLPHRGPRVDGVGSAGFCRVSRTGNPEAGADAVKRSVNEHDPPGRLAIHLSEHDLAFTSAKHGREETFPPRLTLGWWRL